MNEIDVKNCNDECQHNNANKILSEDMIFTIGVK